MADETMLTVEEVASRLRVHPQTVRRWIRSGEITAVRLGTKAGFRVRTSELVAFMGRRETRMTDGE
jgi:excisionase family DNA binding protein